MRKIYKVPLLMKYIFQKLPKNVNQVFYLSFAFNSPRFKALAQLILR